MKPAMIACGLIFASTSLARADDTPTKTSEWVGYSEEYKTGYVSALAQYVIDFRLPVATGPALLKGYSTCIVGQTPKGILNVVTRYIDNNAVANTYTPDVTVMYALYDMCKSYLPKPPKK